ncbi:hypothetical protein HXA35_15565 [Bacillus sp. A301a_S52]|nr:hypothetical protein [Bacillus sp. A301a_S52]
MRDIVRCDYCGHATNMNTVVRKYGEGKQEVYFTCEHCEEHYTCYVTDKRVRRWQRQIKQVKDPIRKLELKMKMKERMDQLRGELEKR